MHRPFCTGALLFAMIAGSVASSARAWFDEGHMAIALIAIGNKQVDKAALVKILEKNGDIAAFISDGAPADDSDGVSILDFKLAKAATWADYVRPPIGPDNAAHAAQVRKYHHSSWHYIDLPYVVPGDASAVKSHPPETPNAVTQLNALYGQLLDPAVPADERAVDLCWMLHVVGDIHQPLHSAEMYSRVYPAGDRGGNAELIRPPHAERPITLHAYWDQLPGNSRDPAVAAGYAKKLLSDEQLSAAHLPQFHPDRPIDFESWAKEGVELASSAVYLNGQIKTASRQAVEDHQIQSGDVPELPVEYDRKAHEIADRQIMLAGLRLGVLLGRVH